MEITQKLKSDKLLYLEKYKILVEHLRHHDRQIWALLASLAVVNGFLITVLNYSSIKPVHYIIISIIGIIVAIAWMAGGRRSQKYTDSIHDQLKKIERTKLNEFDIFVTFETVLEGKSFFQKGGVKTFLFYIFPAILMLVWIGIALSVSFPVFCQAYS